MKRHYLLTAMAILALGVTAATAGPAPAAGPVPGECWLKVALQPTEAGFGYKQLTGVATGWGTMDSSEGFWFNVRVTGGVADGTTFVVYANKEPVGVLTFGKYSAELFLKGTGIGSVLPLGVNPVCAINLIEVVDAKGVVLLEAKF